MLAPSLPPTTMASRYPHPFSATARFSADADTVLAGEARRDGVDATASLTATTFYHAVAAAPKENKVDRIDNLEFALTPTGIKHGMVRSLLGVFNCRL